MLVFYIKHFGRRHRNLDDLLGRLIRRLRKIFLNPADDKPAADFDESYWDRLISVDLTGTALCMKDGRQQMLKQGTTIPIGFGYTSR
ncbi:hypothetical protein BCV73_05500 [Paenibacillus sp. SSG-1]|uniref:hypothetical protein n=1 Tax=Paenibacillus sp. SSG-1 TaxID=1443669 RepID=UPI000B7F51F7|nr:hypothetical protein [Paenibacillus sp. SSG-1]OXL82596.1 hypothetical protein BCV73_05500 [Paenibacillus sp. SSG-1]